MPQVCRTNDKSQLKRGSDDFRTSWNSIFSFIPIVWRGSEVFRTSWTSLQNFSMCLRGLRDAHCHFKYKHSFGPILPNFLYSDLFIKMCALNKRDINKLVKNYHAKCM